MSSQKKCITFEATKKVTKPVIVKFDTMKGPVSFEATKKVTKPVIVKFDAKKH